MNNPFEYHAPDISRALDSLDEANYRRAQIAHQQGQLALADQQQKYLQARQHTDDEIKAADAAHAMLEKGHSPQQAEQTYKAMTKHIPDASPFKVKFPSAELGPVPHSLVEITHGNSTYIFDREAKGRAMAEMERERLARLSGVPQQTPAQVMPGQAGPVTDAQLGLRSTSDIAKGGPNVSRYLMNPDDRDIAETLLRNNAYSYGRGRLVPPPTDPTAGSLARDPELAAILAPRAYGTPSATADVINSGALAPHEAATALTADIGHLGTLEGHRITAQNALDKINLEASYGAFKRGGGGAGGPNKRDEKALMDALTELNRVQMRLSGKEEVHSLDPATGQLRVTTRDKPISDAEKKLWEARRTASLASVKKLYKKARGVEFEYDPTAASTNTPTAPPPKLSAEAIPIALRRILDNPESINDIKDPEDRKKLQAAVKGLQSNPDEAREFMRSGKLTKAREEESFGPAELRNVPPQLARAVRTRPVAPEGGNPAKNADHPEMVAKYIQQMRAKHGGSAWGKVWDDIGNQSWMTKRDKDLVSYLLGSPF